MRVDGRKLSHEKLEEIRIGAVQAIQSGERPSHVAKKMGLYTNQVFVWLAKVREGGLEALKSRIATGRPKRLSGSQIRWIYNTVTTKNPLQLKFEFALWTRGMVRTLIFRKYRVKLSEVSVGRLLAQLGLTCQKPLSKATEQNPSLVEQWLKEEFPRIKALAKRQRAEVYFGDESGVRSDFHAGTTWAKKGETPIVRRTGKRFSLNMISAVTSKGALRFMVTKDRIGSDLFIEFLKRLLVGATTPIFLIVDNVSSHKSKRVQKFLKQYKGRLRLFFLPPYSPELNPDEWVWNNVKNHGAGRLMIEKTTDLERAVTSKLRSLQKSPHKVRGFFQAKTTRYAA